MKSGFSCNFGGSFYNSGYKLVPSCFKATIGFYFGIGLSANDSLGWGWNSWTESFLDCSSTPQQGTNTFGKNEFTIWWIVDMTTSSLTAIQNVTVPHGLVWSLSGLFASCVVIDVAKMPA